MTRKLCLIGLYLFAKPMENFFAVTISFSSACALNFFWPYKSRLVNIVLQSSYFLTTLKYLIHWCTRPTCLRMGPTVPLVNQDSVSPVTKTT